MSGNLLITGFGPFPGMPHNPAGTLARRLGTSVRLRLAMGSRPQVLVMQTAYSAIPSALAAALAKKPDAVLMLGVASRAKRLRVEARARNRGSVLHPDASGMPAARLGLDPQAPAARRSAHSTQALATLRRHGLAVDRSIDAGQYLCNASYFRALGEPCPVLFVHIPPVPRTRRPRRGERPRASVDPGLQAAALAVVAASLIRRSRIASPENR